MLIQHVNHSGRDVHVDHEDVDLAQRSEQLLGKNPLFMAVTEFIRLRERGSRSAFVDVASVTNAMRPSGPRIGSPEACRPNPAIHTDRLKSRKTKKTLIYNPWLAF